MTTEGRREKRKEIERIDVHVCKRWRTDEEGGGRFSWGSFPDDGRPDDDCLDQEHPEKRVRPISDDQILLRSLFSPSRGAEGVRNRDEEPRGQGPNDIDYSRFQVLVLPRSGQRA